MPGKARTLFALAAAILLIPLSVALAGTAEKVVHLSSTDWPPYTKRDMVDGGAITKVVRAAFERAGLKTNVSYAAWPKALEMARKGLDGVIGYYPGYHCRHRAGFLASKPLGRGPLGFAEHVDAPLVWKSLDDIGERKLKIGTVIGYANTDEFDTKVGMGWIHAIPSKDDATSLRKLLRKRLDAVVIDRNVLEYLKATDDSLKGEADKLRFNGKPLENKTLYLCFRDTEEGKRMKETFDRGLGEIDAEQLVHDYFASEFPD